MIANDERNRFQRKLKMTGHYPLLRKRITRMEVERREREMEVWRGEGKQRNKKRMQRKS